MRAILTYHSIDASGSVISLDQGTFSSHAAWFGSGRVQVRSVDGLLADPTDTDAVAITFDDAFANFATLAWPLLRDRGLVATLFVVAGHAGRTNAWGGREEPGIPTLPLLDWDSLGRLAEEGVHLGAHSRTHPDLTRLSDAALEDELLGAAEEIASRTGRRPEVMAYPYGAHDDRVVASAARGYSFGVTTEFRPLRMREHPHALPRLDAYYLRKAGRLNTWGTGEFRRYLWLRGRARRVRATLRALGKPT